MRASRGRGLSLDEPAGGRRASRISNKALAIELGVNHHTLSYWRARIAGLTARRKASRLKRVELVVPARQGTVTLHGPHGVRVDDLTLDDVAQLLRKLS